VDERSVSEIKLVTADTCIHKGKAVLHAVMVSGDGAAGDCDIYDGTNDNGEKIMHIEVLSGTTFGLQDAFGIDIRHGIYVVLNAATTNVMITYNVLHD